MQGVPRQTQCTPAEWTGAARLLQKWLARHCAVESAANLAGGLMLLVLGLLVLAVTSCLAAAVILLILLQANPLLSIIGVPTFPIKPLMFAVLFLVFLGLSTAHAYKTRWGTESAANVDLRSFLSSYATLGWEIFSAGPIILILSAQDFYRYARLSRLDVPHVAAVLLWLYDKGGRASFAEIYIAFPELNAVRVLPQLRDLPGIYWWPEDAAISLSENLRHTFAQILGRGPKSSTSAGNPSHDGPRAHAPVVEVDREVIAWYAALHLPLFAPLQQVKFQYRKLAKIHHPDARSGAGAKPDASDDQQMKRINEAYHNILDHSQNRANTARR
jgi:DnaJ-domain-containing protein 1